MASVSLRFVLISYMHSNMSNFKLIAASRLPSKFTSYIFDSSVIYNHFKYPKSVLIS